MTQFMDYLEVSVVALTEFFRLEPQKQAHLEIYPIFVLKLDTSQNLTPFQVVEKNILNHLTQKLVNSRFFSEKNMGHISKCQHCLVMDKTTRPVSALSWF